mgnify:CR=1 FL=1
MLDNTNTPHILDFGEPEKENSIIKVIGVGGGGGNAVNHMYREGIHDVSFVLCNTDNQALNDSPVPVHLQLGKEGLGAGNKPAKARQAAEETLEEIKHMLNDGTKMAFITAGMGGGTGTGAAPVIAGIAKEMDILSNMDNALSWFNVDDISYETAINNLERVSEFGLLKNEFKELDIKINNMKFIKKVLNEHFFKSTNSTNISKFNDKFLILLNIL